MHHGHRAWIGTVTLLALLIGDRASAHTGYGIVIDREDRICFMDAAGSRVWRVNPEGTLTALAEKHGNNLVQDADGNLYVENMNESLWRIEPDGGVAELRIPGQRVATGALDELLAVDRKGNHYFASGNESFTRDPQLMKRAPTGTVTRLAGRARGRADGKGSAAKFTHLAAAAWGPEGELYVTDAGSVRKVLPDGTVTTLARGLGAEMSAHQPLGGLLGLALDAPGNVYVADSGQAAVHRITPEGVISTLLETEPPWVPVGVAVAADAIYVLECRFVGRPLDVRPWLGTVRVEKLAGGRVATLVTVRQWSGMLALAAAVLVLGLFSAGVLTFRQRRRRAAPPEGTTDCSGPWP
jgi:sugar lactone lactonase YvrE